MIYLDYDTDVLVSTSLFHKNTDNIQEIFCKINLKICFGMMCTWLCRGLGQKVFCLGAEHFLSNIGNISVEIQILSVSYATFCVI